MKYLNNHYLETVVFNIPASVMLLHFRYLDKLIKVSIHILFCELLVLYWNNRFPHTKSKHLFNLIKQIKIIYIFEEMICVPTYNYFHFFIKLRRLYLDSKNICACEYG